MTAQHLLRSSIEHLRPRGGSLWRRRARSLRRARWPAVPKVFVEHYSAIGVKNNLFLDNDSTDGTVEALKAYENVTVLRSKLPFTEYDVLFKQHLVCCFGK